MAMLRTNRLLRGYSTFIVVFCRDFNSKCEYFGNIGRMLVLVGGWDFYWLLPMRSAIGSISIQQHLSTNYQQS